MTVLDVAPEAFVSAAFELNDDTQVPATGAFFDLLAVLDGCTSMAGTDPGGAAWAGSYDSAATALTHGWQALSTGIYRVSCLLERSGLNHSAAETASYPSGESGVPPSGLDPSWTAHFDPLPSAAGGSSDAPTGWHLIEHAVGYVWPGGHQDRLLRAAGAWDAAARTLDAAAYATSEPSDILLNQRSPEIPDAITTIDSLSLHLHSIADGCRALAHSCRQCASRIDTMRSQVEHELADLVGQTVLIEGVGAVFSAVTGGAAEAPTQWLEGWRVREVVAAVRGFIETCIELVKDLADTLVDVGEIGDRVGSALSRLTDLRIRVVEVDGAPGLRMLALGRDDQLSGIAMSAEERAEAGLEEAVENAELPDVSMSRSQAEQKFKHAADLGIEDARGRIGFEKFQQRVTDFVHSPDTVRLSGSYRGDPAIINFNKTTGEMVLQRPDGSFWSAWKLTSFQVESLERTGELGLR